LENHESKKLNTQAKKNETENPTPSEEENMKFENLTEVQIAWILYTCTKEWTT